MKRFMSFVIAAVMVFTAFSAFAQTSELKLEPMYNYTADCTFKMTFDSSEELAALLKEINLYDAFEKYVDVETLLQSLFSLETKMFMQGDVSDDMKRAQIAITADGFQTIDVNKNLDVSIASKTGMWLIYDFSDIQNPVYEMIYSYPFMNKYITINIFDVIPEEEKSVFVEIISRLLTPEYAAGVNAFALALINKHANVTASFKTVTVKIDNEALVAIIKDIIPYIFAQTEDFLGDTISKEELARMGQTLAGLSLDGLQLLGKDGIIIKYNLKNGVISTESVNADFCIDISKFYTMLTGGEWNFISDGKIEFTISADANISKVGTTKVQFPKITEENSISLSDMIKENMQSAVPETETEQEYPYWYAGCDASSLPVINGEIYVPLRATLESAYGESVQISFENGVITAVSNYFPRFNTMVLSNGSDKVYFDNTEKTTGTVIIENGTTYVSSKLFTDIFGWEFSDATYDMLQNSYWYGFYTMQE